MALQCPHDFLGDVQTKHTGKKIHVLVHSIGNKVILHAARDMAAQGKTAAIKSIILCALDFDTQLFVEQIASGVRPLAKHWNNYISAVIAGIRPNDRALNFDVKDFVWSF